METTETIVRTTTPQFDETMTPEERHEATLVREFVQTASTEEIVDALLGN